jgi:nucleoporin NUP42
MADSETVARYNITTDTIEKDLTIETPQWILSSYAPGRNAPEQLFGGYPREQSFEEMRLHFTMSKATGNEQQAVSGCFASGAVS